MRIKSLSVLLVILLIVSIAVVLPAIDVIAKPVEPNPGTSWPSGTIWGTRLRLENGSYVGTAWFGAKTGAVVQAPAPTPPGDFMRPVFLGGTFAKAMMWVDNDLTPPQSYSWYVLLERGGVASSNGTVSCEFENATHVFVPPDFSVVLENSAQGIHVNLRKENEYITGLPKYATLYVDNAVNVTISPSYQEGNVGDNLTYTVIVQNTGRYNDNYTLIASDNLGWGLTLDNNSLTVPANDNRTTMLHVSIDSCALDVITVTADGAYASDSDRTTATVPLHAVILTVDPSWKIGPPCNWLEYTVTVHNVGRLSDNYDLGVTDNLGWGDNIYLNNEELRDIQPCENKQTTLRVHVPRCIEGGTEDNITVTATSKENSEVSDNASCIAHVAIARVIEISISPGFDNGEPCTMLDFMVTIKNTGNVADNYRLSWGDNADWGDNIYLDNEELRDIHPCENKQTTLRVHVPRCIEGGTEDNITVTATSQTDNTVSDSDSCIASVAIVRDVEISISPSYQGNLPTSTLNYTIIVKNKGNVSDNYDLDVRDDAGWNPTLDNYLLESVLLCENKQVTLSVVIPKNAAPGTLDNITITVTSQTDNTVSAENYCTACVFAESTLNLVDGWNLVGFSLTSENMTPNNVFIGLNYYTDYYIYYWTAPGGPYEIQGPNQVLEDNLGYWVWINQDNSVTTIGIPPDNREIHMENGWNLVSFPVVNQNTTPNNVFTGLTYYIDYFMYHWTAPGGPYSLQGPNQVLENDVGYWVWINQDKIVTVP